MSYQFCLAWGLAIAALLYLAGATVAGWLEPSTEVIQVAAIYLLIVPWSYGFWGVLMMASASFNALGKPLPGTVLSFTRMLVVYVPLAITLNHLFGYTGIFIATLASNILMGIAGYLWFRSQLNSMIVTQGRSPA